MLEVGLLPLPIMLLINFITQWVFTSLMYASCVHGLIHNQPQAGQHLLGTAEDAIARKVKVPVILGVMSQCPDALYCEAVFDRVLENVGDIIDLQLSFIGR
jgi:hypothetical protein